MKVYYECAPCILRQAREALDLATDDESLKMEIMSEIINFLGENFHEGAVANVVGTSVHRIIKKRTGNEDPFVHEKKRCNEIAENILPSIVEILKESNSLENYVKAAIVGNLIDFAALGINFDPLKVMAGPMKEPLADPLVINDITDMESALKNAKSVLYLADNTGEIVFDKLLIEKIKEYDVEVTVAVKENPIVNDACLEDAFQVGLDEVAEIITTGTDSIGVIYSQISPEFREIFDNAELIISKGLGNYEGLTEIDLGEKPVFCLLNAKCSATARDIGVELGNNVLVKLN